MNLLFKALGAGPELLPLIKDYMTIWYIGLFFLVVPMVGNSAIRATGDTLTPSLIMTTAGVLNIILDPLLIFGLWGFPQMGLKGAALATVFARGLTLIAAVGVLHFREKLLIWQPPKLEVLFVSWRAILHVGLPAAATNSLGPLANGFITALVARFGVQAVAGFGVATRLEAFSLVALMGLSAAMGPFVGQNWGAGLKLRVHQALKIGFVFALLWSSFVALVLAFWGKSLALHFNADPAIVSVAGIYLGIVPWSFAFEGWRMISNATFNALGKPLPATAITLFKLFGLYVPLAWVGAYYFALPGIFVAVVMANVLTGIISALWIRRLSH